MNMKLSPIALFAYNRPWHIIQTIEALKKNEFAEFSDLIIFSDGAKDSNSSQKVDEVREHLKTISGFKTIRIIERGSNLGLGASIISGVTQVIDEYGRIIVLEDDLVTSPFFLRYMNEALNYYENDARVVSIHGYCFNIKGLPETFFLKGADCLGWATWKSGWDIFEVDGSKLLEALEKENLLSRFDYFGAYSYTQMLRDQIQGKNSSWAVRWYGSALLKDKLTLYPGQSLVSHIGSDGSGTNCGVDDSLDVSLCEKSVKIGDIEVIENSLAFECFRYFFTKMSKSSLFFRIKRKLIGMLKNRFYV